MRAHSVTMVDHTAWLFGGCDDKGCWKDVWCFNTGESLFRGLWFAVRGLEIAFGGTGVWRVIILFLLLLLRSEWPSSTRHREVRVGALRACVRLAGRTRLYTSLCELVEWCLFAISLCARFGLDWIDSNWDGDETALDVSTRALLGAGHDVLIAQAM